MNPAGKRPGGVHRAALDKAPMSAPRLVETILKRYADRLLVAAAAMLDGGPLQLSLELLVVVSHASQPESGYGCSS